MRILGKLIGLFVIVLLGMPALFAVIWANGITSSVLSEGFFDELSTQIVAQTPTLVEKGYEAATQPGALSDADGQRWVAALTEVSPPLPEVLERAGLFAWLRGEVASTVKAVGEVLHGERAPETVIIDMRPLKQALVHPELIAYFAHVLDKLPPCDAAQAQRWREQAFSGLAATDKRLPPCHPGLEVTDRAAAVVAAQSAAIPDTLAVFSNEEHELRLDVLRKLGTYAWLVFLVPILLLGLGAHLGGKDGKAFLRWSGTPVLLAGLFSLLLAGVASGWFLPYLPWHLEGDAIWTSEAGQAFVKEFYTLAGGFIDDMLAPVRTGSEVVSGIGAVLLVISFFVKRKGDEPRPA